MSGIDYDVDLGFLYWDQEENQFQLPLAATLTLDQAALLGDIHNFPPKAHTPSSPGVLINDAWSAIESPISEASTRDVNTALGTPLLLPNDVSDFSYTADIPYPHIDGNDQSLETLHQSNTPWTDAETNSVTSSTPGRPSPPQSPTSNSLDGDNSSSKTRPDVKLRSASRKPKTPTRRKPPVPDKLLHERECHNRVEKQYRTRLKLHFENLLAVLQASRAKDAGPDEDGSAIPDHCFSRGEVLDAARQRILALEKENKQLAMGNDQLLKNMAAMQQSLRTDRAK
ncbi:BHLH domain-containing protein [Fusarium falciforme]|uniref:BHLH domain-containing protein n=1 Tax=Fusarium falciforme TaxID=195108 RepID=UPI002300199F|nr:BHLH domain-containing protein [Fusarium falciforme]WAO97221.1 BHLH domain-containing protein [Fusarium falciforme]